ncbi:MAG: glycosyltransferase family 4 protein [Chlamydia sp.]
MTQFPLLHILNLDTIGGVESLYINFLAKDFQRNFTVVSGKRLNPLYLRKFHDLGLKRPFHERYIFGIRIPKNLRWVTDIRRVMVEHIFTGKCRWVFWNRIEELKPPAEAIYYEHGASWMTEKTSKKERFIRSVRKIIANSHASQIFLSEFWGLKKEEIAVVANPLRPDIQILDQPKKFASNALIRLGYVGRLIPLKAPSTCLYVLHNLLHNGIVASLDIAGVGPEEPFLRQLADRLGIAHQVRFLGAVENVDQLYDSIDFLIVPSIREPLGLVALEAAARGVPVIASSVDGLAESVSDGVSGILISPTIALSLSKDFISKRDGIPERVVDPKKGLLVAPKFLDPLHVTQAIMQMVQRPGTYQDFSQGALEHVRKRLSFDEYFSQLMWQFSTPPLIEDEIDEFD